MGVIFYIKKIDVQDYLNGSKVLMKVHDTYKTKPEIEAEASEIPWEKVKSHIVDVIMAGVVSPELSRKQGEQGKIYVEHLFNEEELAVGIYQAILEMTFGKKKMRTGMRQIGFSK